MRIAGRKNDGAWFRTNKLIKGLTGDDRANLAGSIASSDYIDSAFNALTTLKARTGISIEGIPATASEWATQMATTGIPHQIWFGRLSWTTTTRVGTPPGATYTQDHQSEMHHFGKDLRAKVKQYFLGRRQMRDLFSIGGESEGNPSGNPDATQED